MNALDTLAAAARREWEMLSYPAAPWVDAVTAPDGTMALDCAVIGAGQFGLATTAALRRERIERVLCLDAAPEGREGPWVTFARMEMLRTPKHLTGPDLGLPSLTFRAWWEAQHGAAGWERLFRIPRTAWMDYLVWYRRTLDLPVRNGWRLVSVAPAGEALLALGFETPDGPRMLFARNLVLALGASGAGEMALPEVMRGLPEGRALHANACFDPATLRGERVAVLGAGASAFDMAIAALEAGATAATVCVRRAVMPRANPRRWMESAGYLAHYADLPDAAKWATMAHLLAIGQPPPRPTWERAHALPGFALRTGFPWDTCRWTGAAIEVTGGGQLLEVDRVIAGTGMRVAMEEVPALAGIARHAARWNDRFMPAPGAENPRLGAAPYLAADACFQERVPGEATWIARIAWAGAGMNLSLGPVAASNSGMKFLLPRVVEGVRRRLFLDQQAADWARLVGGQHDELPAVAE
jgi:cation diffusion facilitator CzcD-associated flavoprotein CzcO